MEPDAFHNDPEIVGEKHSQAANGGVHCFDGTIPDQKQQILYYWEPTQIWAVDSQNLCRQWWLMTPSLHHPVHFARSPILPFVGHRLAHKFQAVFFISPSKKKKKSRLETFGCLLPLPFRISTTESITTRSVPQFFTWSWDCGFFLLHFVPIP